MKKSPYKLNFRIVKVKDKVIKEDIGIFRTDPTRNGYYLLLSSDLSGEQGQKESARIGALLKVTKSTVYDKSIPKPSRFMDNQTGQFGWGYFLPMDATDEKTNEILNNLRELKKEYYKAMKMEPQEDTGNLSLNDVKELRSVVNNVQALEKQVEDAVENTDNSQVKNRLEQYFTELQKAIEEDSLFTFLIDNYEKAKKFQDNSKRLGWNYSLLNSMLITVGDPDVIMAGPKKYWSDEGQKVKNEFENNGIVILKPSSKRSDYQDKLNWAKQNPDVIRDFKRDQGYSPEDSVEKRDYQLVKYITKNNLYRAGRKFGFDKVMVYTNNMVEPMEGNEAIDWANTGEDDFSRLEKQYDQNLAPLFTAILSVCKENNIFISDNLRQDLNSLSNFNKVVSALSRKFLVDKMGGESKLKNTDVELLTIRTEGVAQIIKNHYNIKSEASKYNLAVLNADRESLEKNRTIILNTADKIINSIDNNLNKDNIQEIKIRKIISKLIRDNYGR
jgi:hypothetical protein